MEANFNQYTTFIRLTAIGLNSRVSLPLIKCVNHWLKHHGPDWTVSRLKTLKAVYLHKLGGTNLSSKVTGFQMHSDGTPKGPFRPLFRLTSYRGRIKALNALMIYSGITLKNISKAQWKKFHDSVVNPVLSIQEDQIHFEPEIQYCALSSWKTANYSSIEDWINTNKRSPLIKVGVSGLITKRENEVLIDEHLKVLDDPFHKDLLRLYPIPFSESLGISLFPDDPKLVNMGRRRSDIPCPSTFVGRIGFIQEKGGKLRAVANPYRVHQASLSKLGNALFDFLRTSCPWDCTFDQTRGVQRVVENLKKGTIVHTIDLSDATNQFPLTVQYDTIKRLLTSPTMTFKGPADGYTPNEEIMQTLNLFLDVSRAKWNVPRRPDLKDFGQPFKISWKKGQPLGLYPSFAVFAVVHGLLIRSIELDLGLDNCFVVLGDDVAIFDQELARHYRNHLRKLGCPISEIKSLTSNVVSEFAGRIICKEGPLPIEKWKEWNHKDAISSVRQYGLKGLTLVPRKYRTDVKIFSSIPEPVGLGYNPEGLSLGDRMVGVEEYFWDKPESLPLKTIRREERELELAKAFHPWSAHQKVGTFRLMETPKNRSNRPDSTVSLLTEHYNASIKRCRDYEVSDYLIQLRDSLREYSKHYRVRGDPTKTTSGTFLQHIKEVVSKILHYRK